VAQSTDVHRMRTLRVTLQIARACAQGPSTLREIGLAVGVTGRTVRRGIYALRRCGIDVTQARGPQKGSPMVYRLDELTWIAALRLPADGVVTRVTRPDPNG
jgi:hypothetical protein